VEMRNYTTFWWGVKKKIIDEERVIIIIIIIIIIIKSGFSHCLSHPNRLVQQMGLIL
jgi:uncharacterized membrane protein YvbJ